MFNRRDMLSGLAVISMTSVAGCSQSLDSSSTDDENRSTSKAAENTVRQFYTGIIESDVEKANENLHPDHRLYPLNENEISSLNSNNLTIDSVEAVSVKEFQQESYSDEEKSVDRIKSQLSNMTSESGYSDYALVKIVINSGQTGGKYLLTVKDQGSWYVGVLTPRLILEQAQQTGEETTAEISDKINIDGVVGEATSNGGKIKTLNATLRLASGSDPVDLSQVSYTIETPTGTTSVNGDPDEVIGLSYRREQGLANDSVTLSDQEDLIDAELDLSNIDGVEPIQSNTEFELVVNSPNISRSSKSLTTPRNIEASNSYIL